MYLMEFFYCIGWINLLMFIWFATNAAYSYLELFHLFTKLRIQYALFLSSAPNEGFLEFLKHQSEQPNISAVVRFFLKLITCPLCICMWLSLIACFMYDDIIIVPFVYFSSLLIFLTLQKLIQKLL